MTIVNRVPGVFANNLGNIDYMPPITDGLTGLYLMGGSADETRRNRAPGGGASASLVGSPVFKTFSVNLGPDVYLETAQPETPSFTLISIARKPAAGHALISNLNGSAASTNFAHLTIESGPVLNVRARTDPTSANNLLSSYPFPLGDNGFEMFAGTFDDVAHTSMVYMPGKVSQSAGANPQVLTGLGARVANTTTFRIGRARVTSALYAANTDHAAAMIYSKALTQAQIDAIYKHAKKWFGLRDIGI